MAPWVRLLEAWMVQQLLRTPAFHRAVEGVARRVHRYRHGLPPEQPGGTAIDGQSEPGFGRHFLDELKSQVTGAETKSVGGVNIDSRVMEPQKRAGQNTSQTSEITEEIYDSTKAWQAAQEQASQPPKDTFLGAYMDTLREQVRGNKSIK